MCHAIHNSIIGLIKLFKENFRWHGIFDLVIMINMADSVARGTNLLKTQNW